MPDSQLGTARDALLAGAIQVFSEKGFYGTRITDITSAAGVAAGSFYTYFDSKEEILGAVMDKLEFNFPADIPGAPTSDPEAARAWLREALDTTVERFIENARVWRAVQQAALGVDHVRLRVGADQAAAAAAVSRAIQPLVASGLASPRTTTDFVARALVAMTEECLFQWRLLVEEAVEREVAVDRLLQAWSRLLRLPPPVVRHA